MPTDLELEGARLLESTGGDYSKLSAGDKVAVDTLLGMLDSFSSKANAAKSKKDRDYWNKQIELSATSNPHLTIFYDSWKAIQDIEKMNKELK